MRPINIIYCFFSLFLLLLTGCATTTPHSTEPHSPAQRMSASALYTAGKEAMINHDPQSSIRHLNTLITQYPVSELTLQSQLELAYAYHKDGQTSATIATAERFIKKHPQHKNIDYAYYLRGLTSYEAAIVRLNAGTTIDTAIIGAPYKVHMALEFLHELINHFPNGKFSGDTQQRINNLNERVAQYLISAAEQQLDRGNLAKAGLLARAVMEEYPSSPSIQKAAIITNQAYHLLELNSDNQYHVTPDHIKSTPKSDAQPIARPPPIMNHATREITTEAIKGTTGTTATTDTIITTIENGVVSTPLNITPPNDITTVTAPRELIATADMIDISKKLISHRNTRWHSHSSTYRLYLGGHLNAEYSQERALLTIHEDNNSADLTCEYSTRPAGQTDVEEDKVMACNRLASELQTYLEEN